MKAPGVNARKEELELDEEDADPPSSPLMKGHEDKRVSKPVEKKAHFDYLQPEYRNQVEQEAKGYKQRSKEPAPKEEEEEEDEEEDQSEKEKRRLRFAAKKRQNQSTKRIAKKLVAEDWADNVAQNIEQFFRHHQTEKKDGLVRLNLDVQELEQKMARTWVFFLIVVQIVINVVYGVIVVKVPRVYVSWIIAIALVIFFIAKVGSVCIYACTRVNKSKCCEDKYDLSDNSKYKEVLICIPAYNEGRGAFQNTIHSVSQSNFPSEKMYMFIIIDGNRGGTYESAMAVLNNLNDDEEWSDSNQNIDGKQIVQHGKYTGKDGKAIGWTVFVKPKNRGKRDSQWIFVELLRNLIPGLNPPYAFFVDSDTKFKPDSIRYLHETLEKNPRVSGVCGKLTLSNLGLEIFKNDCSTIFYYVSTIFIVGFQRYEYHYNQILGKQAESAYGTVTCLPGAFSMFRAEAITDVEAEKAPPEYQEKKKLLGQNRIQTKSQFKDDKQTAWSRVYTSNQKALPLIKNDFFSRPTKGIIQRNLYELGEDRTLTIRLLEKDWRTVYDPRAIALTECPDTLLKLIQQRRRWNNSTFVNIAMLLVNGHLWKKPRCWPIMLFTLYDLIGAYLLPANALLVMAIVWNPLFAAIDIELFTGTSVAFFWFLLSLVIIASTKIDTSDMFYVLSTLLSSFLMVASAYFFVKDQVIPPFADLSSDPETWPLPFIIIVFPVMHIFASVTQPLALITWIFFYIMFPTVAIVIPTYSFFHLDDFSWGNR